MKVTKEQTDDLMNRLNEVFRSEVVQNNENIISLKTLSDILMSEFGDYNEFFYKKANKIIKSYNRKKRINSIVKKGNIYIKGVIPSVKNGQSVVKVDLLDKSSNDANSISFNFDYYHPDIYNVDCSLDNYDNVLDFFDDKDVQLLVFSCLAKLELFKQNYPGFDFTWDIEHPNEYDKQTIDAGFLKSDIRLTRLPSIYIGFSDVEDIELSTIDTKNHGKIIDYVEFYNEEIKSKIPVNIDDLNPLYREIVTKVLGKVKTKKLDKYYLE